jgi:hypothetical protein
VAQIYPHALGSLSVASYDLQGYGGGNLSRLHTGIQDIVVALRNIVSPEGGFIWDGTITIHLKTIFQFFIVSLNSKQSRCSINLATSTSVAH